MLIDAAVNLATFQVPDSLTSFHPESLGRGWAELTRSLS